MSWIEMQSTYWGVARAAIRVVLVTGLGGMVPVLANSFPAKVPVPADNPMTPQKVALGKQLYFDPRISLTGNFSCDTCHRAMGNGSDGLPLSFGVMGRVDVPRHAPTVFNAAFNTVQFWDGRAKSLEAQAKGPILNPVEMGMPSAKSVVDRLEKIPGYRVEFSQVFRGKDSMTFEHVVQAIATYERTLVTPGSPYDRYMSGDKSALSSNAIAGMSEVKSIGCETCHAGMMFDNPGKPMGTGFFQKFPLQAHNQECAAYVHKYQLAKDPGRFDVTKKPADKHDFKVPSLRNVALEAPYFHNGSVASLSTAVRIMASCQLGKTLSDKQVSNIVAFLGDLTGKFPKQTMPRLPQTPDGTILMSVAKLEKVSEKLNNPK